MEHTNGDLDLLDLPRETAAGVINLGDEGVAVKAIQRERQQVLKPDVMRSSRRAADTLRLETDGGDTVGIGQTRSLGETVDQGGAAITHRVVPTHDPRGGGTITPECPDADLDRATEREDNTARRQDAILVRTGQGQELEIPFRLLHQGQMPPMFHRLDYQPEILHIGPVGQSEVDEASASPHLVEIAFERAKIDENGSGIVLK
jgi:hypothetical protein